MGKISFTVIVVLSITGLASAKEWVYKVIGDDLNWQQVTALTVSDEGLDLNQTVTIDGEKTISSHVRFNKNWETLSWTVDNQVKQIQVKALREDNRIILTGSKEGKPVSKINKIDERPWIQAIPFGVKPFILSDEKKTRFWGVNPVMFASATFDAEKLGQEMIVIGGEKVEAVHAKIQLSGWLSVFWSAEYWFRKSDGQYLRYKGKLGPDMPDNTVVELISESD